MRYMQIDSGQKLHLVYEAGEGPSDDQIIRAGYVSAPICGRGFRASDGGYRMTINIPLAHACKRRQRIYRARHGR